jgi:hypothetical protein
VLEQNAEKNVCTEGGSDRKMEKKEPRGASHLKYLPLLSLRAFVACKKGEIYLPTRYL